MPPPAPVPEITPSPGEATSPSPLTHFNSQGQAHMVDVAHKPATHRMARACGHIVMTPQTLRLIQDAGFHKGDVLSVARVAAIQGAKRTADLIPLCHPLPLTHVSVDLTLDPDLPGVHCTVQAETWGRTGVEMEALSAVQIGLLTVYDMCKAAQRDMVVGGIRLLEKSGGKSGHWRAPATPNSPPIHPPTGPS